LLKTALEWENLRFVKLQSEPSGGTPKRKVGGSNPFWRAKTKRALMALFILPKRDSEGR